MPKHSRKRRRSRSSSREDENRRLERRLEIMQKQLDEINSRDKKYRERSVSVVSSYYTENQSPRHLLQETDSELIEGEVKNNFR